MDQLAKRAQIREDFLSKFIVQARGKADSPNHWHWAKDAVFPLSRDNEVREQWPPLSTIKSNVGSVTKDCDKPASKDNENSASKDGISSASEDNVNSASGDHVSSTCEDRVSLQKKGHDKMNGVEAKCKEWSRVVSKSETGIAAMPKVTNPTNLKTK